MILYRLAALQTKVWADSISKETDGQGRPAGGVLSTARRVGMTRRRAGGTRGREDAGHAMGAEPGKFRRSAAAEGSQRRMKGSGPPNSCR